MTGEADIEEPGPDVSMTEPAIERLKLLLESAGEPPVSGIRLQIARRNVDGFEHLLSMVDSGEEPEDDYELDFDWAHLSSSTRRTSSISTASRSTGSSRARASTASTSTTQTRSGTTRWR